MIARHIILVGRGFSTLQAQAIATPRIDFLSGAAKPQIPVAEDLVHDARVRHGEGQGAYSTPHEACERFCGDGEDRRKVTTEAARA